MLPVTKNNICPNGMMIMMRIDGQQPSDEPLGAHAMVHFAGFCSGSLASRLELPLGQRCVSDHQASRSIDHGIGHHLHLRQRRHPGAWIGLMSSWVRHALAGTSNLLTKTVLL